MRPNEPFDCLCRGIILTSYKFGSAAFSARTSSAVAIVEGSADTAVQTNGLCHGEPRSMYALPPR